MTQPARSIHTVHFNAYTGFPLILFVLTHVIKRSYNYFYPSMVSRRQ